MTLEEAKKEIPDFESFAKASCTNCVANDWYCPSYCNDLEKAQRIFDRVQMMYAKYDGDMYRIGKWLKQTKG